MSGLTVIDPSGLSVAQSGKFAPSVNVVPSGSAPWAGSAGAGMVAVAPQSTERVSSSGANVFDCDVTTVTVCVTVSVEPSGYVMATSKV